MKKLKALLIGLSISLVAVGAGLGIAFGVSENSSRAEDSTTEATFETRTFDQLMTDSGVPSTFAQTTITGTGTASNPYIINSNTDFFYFSYYGGASNKYVELNCDITINDETFDEEGNPSGGDNIVYQWDVPQYEWGSAYFNGNGYTITGIYFEDKTADNKGALFGAFYMSEVKNLTVENVYVSCLQNVYSIVRQAAYLENVSVKQGTLKGNSYVFGLAYQATIMKNCSNYLSIILYDLGISGFNGFGLVYHALQIINCNNYGNITCEVVGSGVISGLCYGLSSNMGTKAICLNSNNYGELRGGYILGLMTRLDGSMINCKNYGDIYRTGGGSIVAGLCSFEGKVLIDNCENVGSIIDLNGNTSNMSELVGGVGDKTSVLQLINCKVKKEKAYPISLHARCTTIIKNLTYIAQDVYNSYLFAMSDSITSLEMQDCHISVANSLRSYYLVSTSSTSKKISLKNVRVSFGSSISSYTFRLISNQYNNELSFDGVIVDLNIGGTTTQTYYGSDFSGFYVSDKTGEIGIKSLSGAGLFQTTLTEAELIKRGFSQASA